MKFIESNLKGLYVIETNSIEDKRGHFFRAYCKKEFSSIGFQKEIVQINQSFNKKKATFRGFHYQKPPFKEVKIIRCIAGKVLDIVIDIRKDSKTFLENFQIELSQDNKKMIYIPEGFAHGFITLEENSQLLYYHSEYYRPNFESGLRYNDLKLNIEFPVKIESVSERDVNLPLISKDFKGI